MSGEQLPPNQQLVRAERWPLVGERSPRVDNSPWTLTLDGLVDTPCVITLEKLRSMPQVTQKIDVHCVTRWSKPQMQFSGVPLLDLIGNAATPCWRKEATYLSFVARSERNHSTSLPLGEILSLKPLVALQAEGEPLSSEHGGPVRLVVPGKYFYKSVKWLEKIDFLAEDRLGYWEAEAGYHNEADPWQEQRYVASTLSKQEAAHLIARRDFRNRDLRSISAASRELTGLQAAGAMLRDANFRGAKLNQADFCQANLSNAHLHSADLRGANFQNADLEGANFCSADLRGANLLGASLFGASFCELNSDGKPQQQAQFDQTTQISSTTLETLTKDQRRYVQSVCRLS